jgi:hypothetical protein
MGDFNLYLTAVGTHWWAFMMGFPFVIDEIVKWFWPSGKEWLAAHLSPQGRRRIEIALTLAGVFIAGFLAWSDEHAARLTSEGEPIPSPSGRQISMEQRMHLTSSLKLPPNESYNVEFNSVPNCEECEDYAQDFRDFISTLPGWKAGGSTLVFSIPYQSGLKLIVRSDEQRSAGAEKLRLGFADAKIALPQEVDQNLQPGMIIVVVGRRPK